MKLCVRAIRRRGALLLICAGLTWAGAGEAGRPPVSLGEVDARSATRDAQLSSLFRASVQDELDKMDLAGAKPRERYVLSARLIKLSTRSDAEHSESTAVVSATLRRADGGALHAILKGRARAVDGKGATASARQSALRAAVRSAIRRVPEALR